MHSLTPAKMPTNKESIRFPEFRTIIQMHALTPSTLTNQPLLGTPTSMFSSIADQL